VNADWTGLRQITPSALGALSAQWSPNGALIAFTSGCCALHEAANTDGSGLSKLTDTVSLSLYAWGSAAAE
jgi:hypothetical protein